MNHRHTNELNHLTWEQIMSPIVVADVDADKADATASLFLFVVFV